MTQDPRKDPEVELLDRGATAPRTEEDASGEAVQHPAKAMRIGAMVRQLLEEVRRAPLDEAGRSRLREIYETSVRELGECIGGDLRDELARLSSPFESPS